LVEQIKTVPGGKEQQPIQPNALPPGWSQQPGAFLLVGDNGVAGGSQSRESLRDQGQCDGQEGKGKARRGDADAQVIRAGKVQETARAADQPGDT
jgi:hypothetical protein